MTTDRARLFAALRLPDPVREELLNWRTATLAGTEGLRLIAPEALHATLCFLGWRAVDEIDEIEAACAVVAGEPVAKLRLGEVSWLPARRPRVVAVELDDLEGTLAQVQQTLAGALHAGAWYTPEARPFLAHVTVARSARDARLRATALAPPAPLEFDGSRITLYRSRLTSAGADYEPLHTVALGASGAGDPLSVVKRFHSEQARVYAGGDMQRLAELLAEDVVWHVPGHSRIAGTHRGRDAVLAYVDLRRQMTDATFEVTVHGIAPIADSIVQLAGGRAERGGRRLSWETVGVFRVRNGRIGECWLVPFDQYRFDEIWS